MWPLFAHCRRGSVRDVLPNLDAPAEAQEVRATGTGGKSDLCSSLSQNAEFTPIQANSNGRSEEVKGGNNRYKKALQTLAKCSIRKAFVSW